MLELVRISKNDDLLRQNMAAHYSQPKGFVGRQILYRIKFNNITYGHIGGGSATLFLPGRNEFFNITKNDIQSIINNIFYHIEPQQGIYPVRNFTSYCLQHFRKLIIKDWSEKYNIKSIGFETLVQLPRTGELYRRDGWTLVGKTKGFTCKRVAGETTDTWTGKRIWDTKNLKPKLVFVRKIA